MGNPPYIRQEEINGVKKKHYQDVAKQSGAKLTARSDIHCYFWPHSLSFLSDDGYLCFLTSSQWLDTDYGFKLQDFILRHFEVVAIFESVGEPWFIGARVVTAATILKRQRDTTKRMENTVRFVQMRRPAAEILAHDGTTAGAVVAADRFRDEIMGLGQSSRTDAYRARLINQGDLWREGVKIGISTGKSKAGSTYNDNDQTGDYFVSKWGMHIRAPDLWFDLLDRFDNRLLPLSSIANIRRGVTTGNDAYFFPKDASQEALQVTDEDEFRLRFQAERYEVESGLVKVVRCGPGHEEMRPLEAEYLEPEVHSLMEVGGYVARPEECKRMILLAPTKEIVSGSYLAAYIAWGEQTGVHLGSTCQGRVTETRGWFDLTGHKPGDVFWPMAQQYRHSAPINDYDLICNHNLFDIFTPAGMEPETLAGVLNSSLSVLSKFQYGRPVGVEGNLKTEVVDVNMMRVPDPSQGTEAQRQRVAKAFAAMKNRPAMGFLSERRLRRMSYTDKGKEEELLSLPDESELTQADRRELDDAVYELLGVTSTKERAELIMALHTYLAEFFEVTRQKEEQAIKNKKHTARREGLKPTDLAQEVIATLENDYGTLLRTYDDLIKLDQPFDTYELAGDGQTEPLDDLFTKHALQILGKAGSSTVVQARNEAQRDLLLYLARAGARGFIRVPLEEATSKTLHKTYQRIADERASTVQTLIEERTADETMQKRVHEMVERRLAI